MEKLIFDRVNGAEPVETEIPENAVSASDMGMWWNMAADLKKLKVNEMVLTVSSKFLATI